jgi:hypothetical protein
MVCRPQVGNLWRSHGVLEMERFVESIQGERAMVKSNRVWGYLGTIWCLLWLLVACASEPVSGVGVPTLVDSGGG